MKAGIKTFAAGILIGGVAAGAIGTFAYTDYIEAVYNDIKIVVDGQWITPTDGNGNKVNPFISDGTTYLPVRAVANAFGKEVDWNGETNTVILGAKSFDWLDQLGYASYDNSHSSKSYISAITSNTTAKDGTKYNRGLKLELKSDNYWKYDDGTVDCYQEVTYSLNNNYKSFVGTLCTLWTDSNDQPALVTISGDSKLLYTSPIMSAGTKSIPFDIDVSGCKTLTIQVGAANQIVGSIDVGIADAKLLKNN